MRKVADLHILEAKTTDCSKFFPTNDLKDQLLELLDLSTDCFISTA